MIKRLISVTALLCASALGQTVTPISQPHVAFVDGSGNPCSLCKLYSYLAGSTTPQPTYVDSGGISQNTNPVNLDASGSANIWLNSNPYKLVLKSANGATLWTVDNVPGSPFGSFLPLAGGTLTGPLIGTTAHFSGNVESGVTCPSGISPSVCAKIINSSYYVAAYTSGGDGSIGSPWTSASGTGGCQEATDAATANGGGRVVFQDGYYSVTNVNGCTPADYVQWDFNRSAILEAGADSVTLIKNTTHAFYAQIWNARLDGNGHASVTGMDVTQFRFGAALVNPAFKNMANGLILRSSFYFPVYNLATEGVILPVHITAGSGGVNLFNPTVDGEVSTACTDGIVVDSTGGTTVGVIISGGYVQGCSNTGITDSAIGTKIQGTYFEVNTVADIYESTAQDPEIRGTQHFAGVGAVAIKGRNTTGASIWAPLMGSGARSTGLYDWDGTNNASYEWHAIDSGSKNTPAGDVTGLSTFASIPSTGDFGSFVADTLTGRAGTDVNIKGGAAATCDFGVKDPTGATNRLAICEPGTGSSVNSPFDMVQGATVDTSVRQGTGLKHQRFGATTPTAASAGATQTTVYAWTAAFADTSYTPVCWGVTPTGTPILGLSAKSATNITVIVTAATADASSFNEVDCVALHD